MIIDKDKFSTEVDHKREEMSKKRHISFWLTEEDMNGYQYQILMPVIFCEDCKHKCVKGKTTRYHYCEIWKSAVDETDFCSRGEKKDDNENSD